MQDYSRVKYVRQSPCRLRHFSRKLDLSCRTEERKKEVWIRKKELNRTRGLAHDFARTTILALSTDLTRAKSGACPHVH
jgi:hypothetical protein